MKKAIFWDNDGVLVNTEHLYFEATLRTLASVGVTLTEAVFVEMTMIRSKGVWHLVAEKGVSPAEIETLRGQRNALYGRLLAQQSSLVIDGVAETLQSLHGRFVMGIVTSCAREHFEIIHRATGLLKYFDFVLADGDYPAPKPMPDPYLAAVQKTGLPAEACLVIEDSERGLISAVRAGLECWVIPNGLTLKGDFSAATRRLDSITDVVYYLSRA